jgi:hypothetical protein
MERAQSLISVIELQKLLRDLHENRPDICIRFRLLGEMWAMHFMNAIAVTERGAIFSHLQSNKLIFISELSNIMQFEIDKPFHGFQPYFHYEVSPVVELARN